MQMDVNTTGIKILDDTLGGGVPVGFTTLVSGPPGGGTELFAKQFASAGKKSENIVYVSTTERNEDVMATMKRFRWTEDMNILNIGTRYYENVLARKLEVSKYRYEGLSKENIEKGKYKVCLEYHMGNCMAPCVGLQEESEYNVYLEQVHQILKGNIKLVISRMKAIMKEYASLQDFENGLQSASRSALEEVILFF